VAIIDEREKAKLRIKIERLRNKLYSCPPERLLETSEKLDKLIVEYQKHCFCGILPKEIEEKA